MDGLVAVASLPDGMARLLVNVEGAVICIDLSEAMRRDISEALARSIRMVPGETPCDFQGRAYVSGEGAVQIFGDRLESVSGGDDPSPVDIRLIVGVGSNHMELHAHAPTKSAVVLRPIEFEGPPGVAGWKGPSLAFRLLPERQDILSEVEASRHACAADGP